MSFTSFAKKAAPWITTIAGAAVPGAAPFLGIASKLLASGLGKEVKADPQSISDAITTAMANPEQLIALKKIDDDFAVQMKQLDIQDTDALAKIAADDVANARDREKVVRDWMPRFLGSTIITAFVAAVFMVLTGRGKVESAMMGALIGYLSAKAEIVLTYYFGSSAGSDRKTELLAQAPAILK